MSAGNTTCNRYDSTKDLDVETKRRAKISASMMGKRNGLGVSGNNIHNARCTCRWCTKSGHPIGEMAGERNPRWKGGVGGVGYGPGWKKVRTRVWERDKVCRGCGLLPYPNRRLDVHHVISRREGGLATMRNLVGLHHGCHMKIEAGKMEIKPPGPKH